MSQTMPSPVIECRDVSFGYNGQLVLEEISFDIPPGDFVALMGPNGGGKTTLLKLLLGLLQPGKGRIAVLGQPPARASHLLGYVPQTVAASVQFPISVLDVVQMGGLMPGAGRRRSGARDRDTALAALARMDAAHLADRRMDDLSGGQRRRVYIARSLVTRPQILLLDEPTAGIDPQGQYELYCLLEQLNNDTTIVMVSHDMLAISTHVKSVACVNHRLHYHNHAEITPEMLKTLYPYTKDQSCPVELVAHGAPHRVLRTHPEAADD